MIVNELESILEDLKTLPAGRLTEAAACIRQLKTATDADRARALDRAYGCLSDAEGKELAAAVEANCETIDASQW